MTVKEFLKVTFNENDKYALRKPVKCTDGFKVSIQGGTPFHYCIPREHVNEYECVELGFPSMEDELIMDYIDDPSCPTGTVYGFVPLEIVEQLINKHGGMVVD